MSATFFNLLKVVIFFVGLFLGQAVMAAPPVLESASYDDETQVLTLDFDASVSDSNFDSWSTIGLSTDNGNPGFNTLPSLATPHNFLFAVADDDIVEIQLSGSDASTLSGFIGLLDSLEVEISADAFYDIGGTNGNAAIAYTDDQSVTYFPLNPIVLSAEFDGYADTLTVVLSKNLEDSTLDVNGLVGLSTDEGGIDNLYLGTPLVEVSSVANDNTLVFQMTALDADTVDAFANLNTSLELYFFSSLIASQGGAYYNWPTFYNNDLSVPAIGIDPVITSSSYDALTDTLIFTFNRDMDPATFNNTAAIDLSTDNGTVNTLTLQTPHSYTVLPDGRSYAIQLAAGDVTAVEGWANVATDLEIQTSFDVAAMISSPYYFNNPNLFANDHKVNYIPEEPVLVNSSYDALTDELRLTFNRDLDATSIVGFATLELSTDNGNINWLAFSADHESTPYLENDRTVVVSLSPVNASTVESWMAGPTTLEVSMPANFVTDSTVTYSNDIILFSDNKVVGYQVENPGFVSASYDSFTDLLTITFNREIDSGVIDFAKYIGLSVDDGFSDYISFPIDNQAHPVVKGNTIEIALYSSDAVTVEGWANVASALEIEIYNDTFYTLSYPPSSYGNAAVSYFNNAKVEYIEAAPRLVAATYDALTDELILTFNRLMYPIDTFASTIGLSTDNGLVQYVDAQTYNYFLDDDFLADGRSYRIGLNSSDAASVEALVNVEAALELQIGAVSIMHEPPGSFSVPVTYADDLVVTYIAEQPVLESVTYDELTDELRLTYNRDLDAAAINSLATLELSIDNGNFNWFGFNANDVQYPVLENKRTVVVQLSSPNASTVESWMSGPPEMLEIGVPAGFVTETSLIYSSDMVTFMDNQVVNYQEGRPALVAAAFDEVEEKLILTFDRLIDPYFGLSNYIGLSTDNGATSYITFLPYEQSEPVINGKTVEIALAPSVASTVTGWGYFQTRLEIEFAEDTAYTLTNPPGVYGNKRVDYIDNMPVEIIPPGPQLVAAAFDGHGDTLVLTFSRLMNAYSFDINGLVELSTRNGVMEALTLSTPHSVTALPDGYSFEIALAGLDGSTIEAWTEQFLKDSLEVQIGPLADMQNGPDENLPATYEDNIAVDYIPVWPELVSADFDALTDELRLTFSQDIISGPNDSVGLSVDNANFDFISFSIYSHSSPYIENARTMVVPISASNASIVEGWTGVETTLEVEITNGLVRNAVYTTYANNQVFYSDDAAVNYISEEPKFVSASYDSFTNLLSVTFDRVIDEAAIQTSNLIEFSVDDGSYYYNNMLLDSQSTPTVNNGNNVIIELDSSTASTVEGWMEVKNRLEIQYPANTFYTLTSPPAQYGNYQVQYLDDASVAYIEEAPQLISYSYDAFTDSLTLTFNRVMDLTSFNNYGMIELSVDNGFFEYLQLTTPHAVILSDDGYSFIVQLDSNDASTIESWANVETALDIMLAGSLATMIDVPNESSEPVYYVDEQPGNYIVENPQLLTANYDAYTNELRLTFNRDIDPAAINNTANIELSSDGGYADTFLFSANYSGSPYIENNRTVVVSLQDFDASSVESWYSYDGLLEVEVESNFVFTASPSYGNLPVSFSDEFQVTYVPEAPVVVAASYDAYTDILAVTFNRDLKEEDVREYYNIGLSTDDGSFEYFSQSMDAYSPITLVNQRTILVQVGSSNASQIESWADLDTRLELYFSSLVVSIGEWPNVYENETVNYSDNVSVEFIELAPTLASVSYDEYTDTLRLVFNRDMAPVLNDSSEIRLSVDNGDVSTVFLYLPYNWLKPAYDDRTFEIQVAEANILENWPDVANKLEIAVSNVPSTLATAQPPLSLDNQVIDFSDNYKVDYISSAPKLIAAVFDAVPGELRLTFNRDLDIATLDSSIILYLKTSVGSIYADDSSSVDRISLEKKRTLILKLPDYQANNLVQSLAGELAWVELASDYIDSTAPAYASQAVERADRVFVTFNDVLPTLVSARYDSYSEYLDLTFNQDIDQQSLRTDYSFGLSVDNGGIESFSQAMDSEEIPRWLDARTLRIKVSSSNASQIESWGHPDTRLEVYLSAYVVSVGQWPDLYENQTIDYSDNIKVDYIEPDPVLASVSYDAYTDKLMLLFNRDMDPLLNEFSGVGLSVDNGGMSYLSLPTPLAGRKLSRDDRTFEIELGGLEASTVEGWFDVENSLEIELTNSPGSLATAQPPLATDNMMLTFSDNVRVDFIAERPVIDEAHYDALTNQLRITFNRPLESDVLGSGHTISLSVDDGYLDSIFFAADHEQEPFVENGSTVVIELSAINASTVESWSNVAANLKMEVQADFVRVLNSGSPGLENLAVSYSDNVGVRYIEENPAIVAAQYDAYTKLLSLTFNRDLDELAVVGMADVRLSVDEGFPSYIYQSLDAWATPQLINRRTLVIRIGDANAATISGWVGLDKYLEVRLNDAAVYALSEPPGIYPNSQIDFPDNVAVEYIGEAPRLLSAQFDKHTDTLSLTFNRAMGPLLNDTRTIRLSVDNGGLFDLTLPQPFSWRKLSSDDTTFEIQLAPADAATIEGWGFLESDLEIELSDAPPSAIASAQPPLALDNEAVLYSDNQRVTLVEEAPVIVDASYDEFTNELRLTYNRDLDPALLSPLTELGITEGLGDGSFGASDVVAPYIEEYRTVVVTIPSSFDIVEQAWGDRQDLLRVRVDAGFVSSTAPAVASEAVSYEDNIALRFIENEPAVVAASLDVHTRLLRLTFSRKLDPVAITVPNTIGLSVDNGFYDYISQSLDAVSDPQVVDGHTLVVELSVSHMGTISGWSDVESLLELTLDSDTIYALTEPPGLYRNRGVQYEDGVSVDYVLPEPEIVAAQYDEATDRLSLTFNRELDQVTLVDSASVQLSTDNGGVEALTLQTPLFGSLTFTAPPQFGGLLAQLNITLDAADATTLESWNYLDSLEVSVPHMITSTDPNGGISQIQSFSDNVAVEYIVEAPQLNFANYDAYSNRLELYFNRLVTLPATGTLALSVDNGSSDVINITMDAQSAPAYVVDSYTGSQYASAISVELTPADAATLEAWSNVATALKVELPANQITGSQYNLLGNLPVAYGDDHAVVNYIPEGPQVVYATYDRYWNELHLRFNRELDLASLSMSQIIGLSTADGMCCVDEFILMANNAESVALKDNYTLVVELTAADALILEGFNNFDSRLELYIQNGLIYLDSMPPGLYGNIEQNYTDNISVYIVDENPQVIEAFFHEANNQLEVEFHLPLDDSLFDDVGTLTLMTPPLNENLDTPLNDISAQADDSVVTFQLSALQGSRFTASPSLLDNSFSMSDGLVSSITSVPFDNSNALYGAFTYGTGSFNTRIQATYLAAADDYDGDGTNNGSDALPRDATETLDTDGDGIGNNADTDDDGDGFDDGVDAFPLDPTEHVDSDGDGVGDNGDNCPQIPNPGQEDWDNDGSGDACSILPLNNGYNGLWLRGNGMAL